MNKFVACFIILSFSTSSSVRQSLILIQNIMSHVMSKPAFCICENKVADQLHGNRAADQRLCFRYIIVQSLYFPNPKFQASNYLLWL